MHGNMNIQISEKYIGFLIRKLIFVKIKTDSPKYAVGKLHHSRNCDSYAHHILHLILIGKGDDLIAGYNTASKEERAKYDIGRLRKVSGYGLLLTCLPTGLLPLAEMSDIIFWSSMISMIIIAIVVTILANTYARR